MISTAQHTQKLNLSAAGFDVLGIRQGLLQSIVTPGCTVTAKSVRDVLVDRHLGKDTVENSAATTIQFITILAVCGHPRIQDLAKTPNLWRNDKLLSEAIAPLFTDHVLTGMKILDVGSGIFAATAKLARALGAECWTVDRRSMPGSMPGAAWHIELDVGTPHACAAIEARAGGSFDVITEANIEADGGTIPDQVMVKLLRVGGVFASGSPWWKGSVGNVLYIKEGNGELKRIDQKR